ncbi:CGNR zinc finger domain-containing protein [Pseudomonas sp. Pseusp122]|uniref:CGNR zinc finger domain-containing protein n=1 Tax=unclassified Pseudomonas TaxID=196821 RepID=UPI0039A4F3FD
MTDQESVLAAYRLVAFLNSRGVGFERDSDQLDAPETYGKFRAKLFPDIDSSEQESLPAVRKLRDALLALVTEDHSDAALARLNELSTSNPFQYRFTADGAVVHEQQSGPTLIGMILQDVAQLFEQGNWNRLKICHNPACVSAFYDTTRARTQRWHSYAICGNKANVAAHRARVV